MKRNKCMKIKISAAVSVLSLLIYLASAYAEAPASHWVGPGQGGIVEAVVTRGGIIVSADGATVKVWSTKGQLIRTIYASARAVDIAPNGDTIAVGGGDGIALYSIFSGQRLAFVASEIGECSNTVPTDSTLRFGVHAVRFSPDGLWLVTGGGCYQTSPSLRFKGELKMWNASDLSFIRNLPATNGLTRTVAWTSSDDGNGFVAAAGAADSRVIISRPDGSVYQEVAASTSDIASIAFSSDSTTLAVGGSDEGATGVSLEIFKKPNENDGAYSPAHTLSGHTHRVTSVTFVTDSVLASGSLDRTIRYWSCETGDEVGTRINNLPEPYSPDYTGGVQSLAGEPSILVSGGALGDGSLRSWYPQTNTQILKFNYHQDSVTSLAYRHGTPGSAASLILFSTGADNQLFRWFANEDEFGVMSPVSFLSTETIADYTPHSEYAAVYLANAATNNLFVRELATGTRRYLEGAADGAYQAKFSPDGQYLAAGDQQGYLRVWQPFKDVNYKYAAWKKKAHDGRLGSINITPDGQRIITTGYKDHVIKVYKLADGTLERTIEDFSTGDSIFGSDFHSSLALSPDGTMFAVYGNTFDSAYDTKVRVYRLRDGTKLKTLDNKMSPLIFTPDNKSLGSAVAGGWIFNSLSGDSTYGYFYGSGTSPRTVALAPDGQSVSVSWDNDTVTVHRSSNGEILREYDENAGYVGHIAYTPDSSRIAWGGLEGTVRLITNPVGAERGYISITSFNPESGVQVKAPEDQDGRKSGTTPFVRSYSPVNVSITFTAPETSNGKYFHYWIVDGASKHYSRSLAVSPKENRLLTVVYGKGVAPTPTPVKGAPRITKVKKTASGGFQLVLSGKNFKKGIKVYINSKRWKNFKVVKSSRMNLNGGTKLRKLVKKRKPAALKLVAKSGGAYTVFPYRWK